VEEEKKWKWGSNGMSGSMRSAGKRPAFYQFLHAARLWEPAKMLVMNLPFLAAALPSTQLPLKHPQ
jgi:hypothetical protein